MPFAAAVSVHPVTAHATGEVIGQVVEEVGTHPDLVVLLVSPGHAGALEDVARTITTLLAPTVLIGATASAVIGDGADEGGGPGLALWAGMTGPVRAWSERNPATENPGPFAVSGMMVLATPDPSGAADFVGRLGRRFGPLPVAGATTDAGPLVLGDRILPGGAVGAMLGPGVGFEAVVARNWRPVGPPLTVTEADADRGLIRQLDGVAALDRLRRLTRDEVPAGELPLMQRHLAVGAGSSAGNGDSPVPEEVWEVRGADRSNGVIAAAGPVPAGTTVHFWVRDDPGRHLRRALIGRSADTALAFVADPVRRGYDPMSRDPAARGAADHDAAILAEQLRIDAVTGMVASTQIGPVKGALRALDADVSVALLTDR